MSDLLKLAKPFPAKYVHENPSGGGSYVKHHFITQKLLADLGAYQWEIVEVVRGYVDAKAPNPKLLRFVGLLEHATQETRRRGIDSARADAAFRTAWAIATLAADEQATNDGKKLTVATREALAVRATGPEFLAKREAEEVLHAARSASSNLREMVGALRTIATNLRELVRS